jgi:hypothetical protein
VVLVVALLALATATVVLVQQQLGVPCFRKYILSTRTFTCCSINSYIIGRYYETVSNLPWSSLWLRARVNISAVLLLHGII